MEEIVEVVEPLWVIVEVQLLDDLEEEGDLEVVPLCPLAAPAVGLPALLLGLRFLPPPPPLRTGLGGGGGTVSTIVLIVTD